MCSPYDIPAKHVRVEQEIKRSRFVTDISHAAHRADALAFIQQVEARETDARHHCWAYIAGSPVETSDRGCSDAGEPQGTAGKPMLNVLQHRNIGEIVVVTSRYFGGIKLGAGGLVRAYTSSVQQAVDALPLRRRVLTVSATIHAPFSMENTVRRLLKAHAVPVLDSNYQSEVALKISVERGREITLEKALNDASNGTARIRFPDVEP